MKSGEGFGGRIAKLRKAAGLTQEALAKRMNVSVATIQKIEQGRREGAYSHTLQSAAEVLGTTVDNILGKADGHSRSAEEERVIRASQAVAHAAASGPVPQDLLAELQLATAAWLEYQGVRPPQPPAKKRVAPRKR